MNKLKIELINIQKNFNNQSTVLENVNAIFETGKIYGLIGGNGSGKSVLLKIICGLYKPTEGKVIVDGEDIFKEQSFPKDTRALIEKPNFLPELTGLENLELLASIQKKISKNEILETLKKVKLEKEMNKKFGKYSLGMKQKLGIAQVLMEDPKIMIFDEPFNGIEVKTANEIRNLLIKEKEKGKLIIISSHMVEDTKLLADEVYELSDYTLKKVIKNSKKDKKLLI